MGMTEAFDQEHPPITPLVVRGRSLTHVDVSNNDAPPSLHGTAAGEGVHHNFLLSPKHCRPHSISLGAASTNQPSTLGTPDHTNNKTNYIRNSSGGGALVVATPPAATSSTTQARKVYRKDGNKWVTREIAVLDFLLGIPLAAEEAIVQQGWALQQKVELEQRGRRHEDEYDLYIHEDTHASIPRDVVVTSEAEASKDTTRMGRWWEQSHNPPPKQNQEHLDESELEQPEPSERVMIQNTGKENAPDADNGNSNSNRNVVSAYAPGRRLQGDDAVRIQIPLTTKTLTKQKMIARQAALREWELQTSHGLNHNKKNVLQHPPLLDGRLFFSASGSYPMSVFSLIRYEPKKEEMQQLRQKLEALGGGGSQFVMPGTFFIVYEIYPFVRRCSAALSVGRGNRVRTYHYA